MTKRVRIENADTSNHKLVVQTWRKVGADIPDVLISEKELHNPTDMTDVYVWQGQYIVITEKSA